MEMTDSHAAGWSRFNKALNNIGRDAKLYPRLLNSHDHRDAVEVLGRGTEDELKHLMAVWRFRFPMLFED